MPNTYTLTAERAAAYAKVFDFRTSIVRAGRQILAGYNIAAVGPGQGEQQVPRYYTSLDFQRGAATGRKSPVILGNRRYSEYSEFLGVFSIMNTVPMETDEKMANFLTEDHLRELDRLTSLEDAIFMEHLAPWIAALLPLHEVTECFPIEPDERPIEDRELNAAFRRWRLKVNIRYDAWPAV